MKTIGRFWPLLSTTPEPSLQRSLGKGRDAAIGVHVGHREDCQVMAVAAVDGHIHREDLFILKNLELMRLAGL
jgi:hypothetical protein